MVNLFPDVVQHDTPAGRKASYVYITLLSAAMLAAVLFYSLQYSSLVKTTTSTDSFFGLEMYEGTTNCDEYYACLDKKSTANPPTVTGLRCDCKTQAGELSRMTRYPMSPGLVVESDWCASTNDLHKLQETLPALTSSVSTTQEPIKVVNLFSSKSSCAAAPSSTSSSGTAYATFSGASSATVLDHITTWRSSADAAIGVTNYLRLSPDTVPNASVVAGWLLRDTYLEVGVSASQAAKDVASAASGLSTQAKSGTVVTLSDFCNGGSSAGAAAALYWPLVIQVNSRCKDKKLEAEKFYRAVDSTYIISSTLLNKDSYDSFHKANRVLQSTLFTTAPAPPGTPPNQNSPTDDPFTKFAMLGAWDYLEGFDNLQLFYPLYTSGYALAYAEYTQTFVLQYSGLFDNGSTACSSETTAIPACQLTFTETLKSVFPLTDTQRTMFNPSSTPDPQNPDLPTKFRASVFHPTRTAGGAQKSAIYETLTFQHIFGRGSLLTGETGQYEDLTPLSNTGASINTTSVFYSSSYTNGNYAITDPHDLKQTVRKRTATTTWSMVTPLGPNQNSTNTSKTEYSQYVDWGVKVVSMSASITSLKVIWKHVSHPYHRPFPAAPPPAFLRRLFLSARKHSKRPQAGLRANPAAAACVSQRQLHIPTSI